MTEPINRGPARPFDHLVVALAFGCLTALVEILSTVLHWTVMDRFAWTGESMFWMVPLYYVSGFLVLGGAAAVLSLFSGRRLPLWLTAGVSAAISVFSLLLLVFNHKLATIAIVLLAAGAGVQMARAVKPRQDRFSRRLQPLTLVLFVIVALIAVGQPILRELAERRALARLPNASAGAPNILLIILDTVRASSLGLYGYDQPTTPGLDRRAEEGVVFERALSTSSWTLPSHASMFTGRYPYRFLANWETPLDSEFPTLAEVLQEHGYATGGFVANLLYTQRESGLARGFIHYEDFRVSRKQLKESTALGQRIYEWQGGWVSAKRAYDRKPGEEVSSGFLQWVDQTRDAPFFAFLNYYDAHVPYRAPQPWRDRFDTGRRDQDRYNASIAFLDHEIDGLLRDLEARGRLENTIVVVTADHGELFGEHGLEGHGNGLYDPTLHVPLVIWYPPVIQSGARIDRPVTLRDLPATLLDLAGIANHPLGGASLRPLLRGDTTSNGFSPPLAHLRKGIKTPPDQPVSRGDMYSLYRGSLHYILNGDGMAELYDVEPDPAELRNLARVASHKPVLQALSAQLKRYVDSTMAGQ